MQNKQPHRKLQWENHLPVFFCSNLCQMFLHSFVQELTAFTQRSISQSVPLFYHCIINMIYRSSSSTTWEKTCIFCLKNYSWYLLKNSKADFIQEDCLGGYRDHCNGCCSGGERLAQLNEQGKVRIYSQRTGLGGWWINYKAKTSGVRGDSD